MKKNVGLLLGWILLAAVECDGKTLDGRDIFCASIYWTPLYISGSIVFSLVLLACAIQRWCLKSPCVRRFPKFEKTNKKKPSEGYEMKSSSR